jgi:hypothetical protein
MPHLRFLGGVVYLYTVCALEFFLIAAGLNSGFLFPALLLSGLLLNF